MPNKIGKEAKMLKVAETKQLAFHVILKSKRQEIHCKLVELTDIISSFFPLTDTQLQDLMLRMETIASDIRNYLAQKEHCNV